MSANIPLLLWDNRNFFFQSNIPFGDQNPYNLSQADCPWCTKILRKIRNSKDGPSGGSAQESGNCEFCGWGYSMDSTWSYSVHWGQSSSSCLMLRDFNPSDPRISFKINDLRTPLDAVGTYLKSHYSDIYNLNPRRFEQLIEDVFRNSGFRTRLTQQTRDGGADIILLGDDNENLAIVEVKRYSMQNAVGIELVDRLIGAAIRWDVRKAYLVTSSRFSTVATSLSTKPLPTVKLELELWDTHRILAELKCYSDYYPPLNLIDPDKPLTEQQK